jgi:2'-5' RNA ligase
MPFRAFISADLPAIASIESLIHELREASRDLKLVSAEHFHVTLKFLGDTEEGLIPEVVSAMREASTGIGPFTLAIRGSGAFPSLSRPRVLWVGLEGADPLARVARSLDEHLRALGFGVETKPWSAHVTLARVRGPRGLDRALEILRRHEDETFAEVRIEEIHLKKSVLQGGGPEYTTVESVKLEE